MAAIAQRIIPWNVNQTVKVVIHGRTREITCTGKKQYDTLKFAQRVAQQAWIKRNQNLEAYGCPFCKSFHIGHPIGANS